jgi:cytoskeletal protein CcmA (bactofilin family)
MRRHVAAVVALALVSVVAVAAPALAGRGVHDGVRHRNRDPSDRRISITGDIHVARGEVVDGQVATFDGSVRVDGTVTDYVLVGEGDLVVTGRVTRGVVVLHGNARISGRVGGDVVALSGSVTVTRDGSVGGDVVSRRDPQIARGTVEGEVRRVDLRALFTGLIIGTLAYLWLAVTISMALLGLVFVGLLPRAADTAAAAGKRISASFGWGALIGIVGPMAAVLVLVSILGIPLGLTMLSALNVLAPIGYVTTALIIGRLWVKGRTNGARMGAFFAGFGILRLLALIPGLGFLVWFVACIYGLGAASMAAWYGGHRVRPGTESVDNSADESAESADEPVPARAESADESVRVGAESAVDSTPRDGDTPS